MQNQRNLDQEFSEAEVLDCDRFGRSLDIGSRQGVETETSGPAALRGRDP